MGISREEVLGPGVCFLRYQALDEAVAIVSNTDFELGGVVFTSDEVAGPETAERMDTGSVGINFFGSNHNAPFSSRHGSGLDVEYGIEGLSQYVAYTSIHRRADRRAD